MTETTVSIKETKRLYDSGYIGLNVHRASNPRDESYTIIARNDMIEYEEEKTSVVSGSFTPGDYRVNPYSVKGCRFKVADFGDGAHFKSDNDIIPGHLAGTYPGIRTVHFDMLSDPFYFISVPFVNTSRYASGGYVPGETYHNVVWVSGEWWRIRMARLAIASTPPHVAADYEQLSLQKAYGKLLKADLDLGESLGEYKETIQMLRHPLSALKKFMVDDRSRNWRLLRALAQGDKRQVNRLLGRTGLASADTMAGTWLELRYGFRPLVSLVQDVIDRIHDKQVEILDPEKIRSARSKLEFGPIVSWAEPRYMSSLTSFGPNIRSRVKVEDTYVSLASVQYLQTEEQSFLDTLGLTPRFLPEVAWELTRLSFVVDWIFSIGPWLSTLRINPGITVLGNTTGFKHTRKVSILSTELCVQGDPYGRNIPWTVLPSDKRGSEVFFETNTYERKVDTDLSYTPHFTWGRTLDLFKAIDSVSLIWQFIAQLRR